MTVTAFDFMDTVSSVTLYESDADAAQGIFDLCRALDQTVDMRKPDSDIGRLNASSGQRVVIAADTVALLRAGKEASLASGGQLDITIGSVSALWDFTTRGIPDEKDLNNNRQYVGISNLSIGEGWATVRPGTAIDLGALAKGYALDMIDDFLAKRGIDNALVNIGGSVLARGVRPDGKPWRVGIQQPFGAEGELLGVLEVSNLRVVTAGIYERYFDIDGKIYHHILDTQTGMPVDSDVWSATIVTTNGLWADAYSTICVLKGSQSALEYIESLANVECIIALNNGGIVTSSGFETLSRFKRSSLYDQTS